MKIQDLIEDLSNYDPDWEVEGEFEGLPAKIEDISSDMDMQVVVIYLVRT